jgi:hypothetical protein
MKEPFRPAFSCLLFIMAFALIRASAAQKTLLHNICGISAGGKCHEDA